MSYSYFETMAGRKFTECTLPELTEAVKLLSEKMSTRPQQYVVSNVSRHDLGNTIRSEIESGARYVDSIKENGDYIIIFER